MASTYRLIRCAPPHDWLARLAVTGKAISAAGDFHDLPYCDNWFDLVFVASAAHHTWRPEKVVAEMLRVLRPGGLLMLDNELIGGRLCRYRFHSNRAESFTKLAPIATAFELAIEADAGTCRAAARDVLERGLATATPLVDDRNRSLGMSLPSPDEIEELLERARRLGAWIAEASNPIERVRRRADTFGAALHALIRKCSDGITSAGEAFRRQLPIDRGIRIDLPRDQAVEIGLDHVLLPTIDPAEAEALAIAYPSDEWLFHTEGNGAHVEMNRSSGASIRLPNREDDCILLLCYYWVASETGVYRVRFTAGNAIDEHEIAQSESRLARLFVPSDLDRVDCALVVPDGAALRLPTHRIRVTACRLVSIRWQYTIGPN